VERRLLTVIGCLAVAACASAPQAETTSIRKADCVAPPVDIAKRFDAEGVSGQQCPGIQGWQVFVVSSDANAWLELHAAGRSWSFEEPIVYEEPIGLFPNVDGDTDLEWRVDSRRGPVAVIVTIGAQHADETDRRVSRYFVIRLDGTRNACVIGREATIDAARSIADGETPCGSG
jgi:hypothetical protein